MDASPSGVNRGKSYAGNKVMPKLSVTVSYTASDGEILNVWVPQLLPGA